VVDGADFRRISRARVLGSLVASGRASRAELAATSGLSRATVSRVVEDLIAEGTIREREAIRRPRGRSVTPLELVGERGVVCGVDLGATTVRIALADLSCRPLGVERAATPNDRGAAGLARWLAQRIRRLCREVADEAELWATAVGVPGVVHPETRGIRLAPNLPGIAGTTFVASLERHLDGAVSLDNDANFALLGEMHFGAARGLSSAVMFTIGTGVGAGVAVDSRLQRGPSGFVGEFGNMVIGSGSSTLESVVAGPALVRAAARRGLRISSPADVFLRRAPSPLREVRDHALQALLVALSATTVAYEPQIVVLGGGVAPPLGPWLPGLRRRLAGATSAPPQLVLSELGDLAGTAGALAKALENAYTHMDLVFAEIDGILPASYRDEILDLLRRS